MEQVNEVVRQLVQNQQEMQAQLASLRSDNEELRSERSQAWGQLPGVLEALRAQADASRSSHERVQLVDTRGIGRPKTFTGDEDAFRSWAAKMESFVTAVFGEEFRRVLEWAVEKPDPVLPGEWNLVFGDDSEEIEGRVEGIGNKVQQLHMALAQLTECEAFDITQNSGIGNGLEAWRKLHRRYDPTTGGRKRNLLRAIISPGRCRLEELGQALEKWEEMVVRYERRRDDQGRRELVPEAIKMAALESLVPEDMEKHLLMNQSRLGSYELLRREVVAYMEARTGVRIKAISVQSKKDKTKDPNAMDIDGFVKGSKGKGKEGGNEKGHGRGKDGACFVCGKLGHRAANCWQRPDSGNDGKGSKKGKGKNKDRGIGKGQGKGFN